MNYNFDKTLLQIAWQNQKFSFFYVLIIIIIGTIIDYLFIASSFPFLHYLTNESKITEAEEIVDFFRENTALEVTSQIFWVYTWIILAVISSILKIFFVFFKSYTSNMYGYYLVTTFIELFTKLTYESAKSLDSKRITSMIAAKVNLLVKGTVQPFINLMQALISIILLITTILFFQQYELIILFAIIFIYYLLLTLLTRSVLAKASTAVNFTQTRQIEFLNDLNDGYKDLYVNNMIENTNRHIKSNELLLRKSLIIVQLISESPRFLLELFVFVIMGILLINIENFFSGIINLSLVGTIVVGFARVVPILQLGFVGVAYVRSSKAIYEEFTELVIQMSISIKRETQASSELNNKNFDNILINIKNHNDGEDRPNFKNLSININKGDKIALVGKSGSGKTSLMDLILGLNKIKDGKITITRNGKKFNVADLRAYVSLIPQQIFVKYGNIIENFKVYLNNEDLNFVSLKKSMIYSNLIKKNMSNDEFYSLINTKNVKNLSGGEKQRFAFSRAFYQKKNFLMIDEGTSNLDEERKSEILNILCGDKDKTLIFITHDSTILSRFNKIYQINNGKIKQRSD